MMFGGFLTIVILFSLGVSCERTISQPGEQTIPITDIVQQQTINSFVDCVATGNPVMESYPRQCRAQGKIFVEEVEKKPVQQNTPVSAPSVTIQPVVSTPAPQDSMAADPNAINFGTNNTDSSAPVDSVDNSDINSLYDADGHYYTDPDYDPTRPFDVDAYNQGEYDNTESNYDNVSEPQDSIATDPNACSTEGASYMANDTTYYCVDGIWTMSDYAYPYQ